MLITFKDQSTLYYTPASGIRIILSNKDTYTAVDKVPDLTQYTYFNYSIKEHLDGYYIMTIYASHEKSNLQVVYQSFRAKFSTSL